MIDRYKKSEVSTSALEGKISNLTNLVRQMAVNQVQNARVCGICSMSGVSHHAPRKQERFEFHTTVKVHPSNSEWAWESKKALGQMR